MLLVFMCAMQWSKDPKKQQKTAKFLLKTGTNLNKILDIHVIEDFIKALQCATLILLVFMPRNAMEQRPQ